MKHTRIVRPLTLISTFTTALLAPPTAQAGVVCQVGLLGEMVACCAAGCGNFGVGCASGSGNYEMSSGSTLGSACPALSVSNDGLEPDDTVDNTTPVINGPGAVATFVRDEVIFEFSLRRMYANDTEAEAIDDVAFLLTVGEDSAASRLERGDVSGAIRTVRAAVDRLDTAQASEGSAEESGANLHAMVGRLYDAAFLGARSDLERRSFEAESTTEVDGRWAYLDEAAYSLDVESDPGTALELLEEATLEPAATPE